MIEDLLTADQLLLEKNAGGIFHGFREGDIKFAPTYKYDLFSDDYDTSEKMRVPAYTDRILFKRRKPGGNCPSDWKDGEIVSYDRVNLKQSDHRPVFAMFDVETRYVDTETRERITSDLVTSCVSYDGNIILCPDQEIVYTKEIIDEVTASLSEYGQVTRVTQLREGLMIQFGTCTKLSELLNKSITACDKNWKVSAPSLNADKMFSNEIGLFTCKKDPNRAITITASEPVAAPPKRPPPRPKAPPPRPAPPPARPAAPSRPAPPKPAPPKPEPPAPSKVETSDSSGHDSPSSQGTPSVSIPGTPGTPDTMPSPDKTPEQSNNGFSGIFSMGPIVPENDDILTEDLLESPKLEKKVEELKLEAVTGERTSESVSREPSLPPPGLPPPSPPPGDDDGPPTFTPPKFGAPPPPPTAARPCPRPPVVPARPGRGPPPAVPKR